MSTGETDGIKLLWKAAGALSGFATRLATGEAAKQLEELADACLWAVSRLSLQSAPGILASDYDALEAERDRLREALEKLLKGTISTRTIVNDHIGPRKLGHNPSWVKAADIQAALALPTQEKISL